uniref:Lipocalin-2 1 n=1 Tax=Amblyomma cajennense TaxID=34607 RepID=A0A023FQN6_AMBCJ
MLVLFFAVYLQLAAASGNVPTLADLVEALNTTEKVWLILRSYDLYWQEPYDRRNCVYVEKNSFTQDAYNFTQHYITDGEKKTLQLRAKLLQKNRPVMNVILKPGRPNVKYTLRSWNKEHKCGLLMFKDNNEMHCEMYAWDSKVVDLNVTSSNSCEDEYDNICKKQRKYDGNAYQCQRALNPPEPPAPACR